MGFVIHFVLHFSEYKRGAYLRQNRLELFRLHKSRQDVYFIE